MRTITTLCAIAVLFFSANLFPQATGDYQSNGVGMWDAAATWQTYNGSAWVAAAAPPTGSENITIQATDSVDVDIPVTITGYVKSLGGKLGNSTANLTFDNKSTFEWATNGGSIPVATWNVGSTCLYTGITANMPSNSAQNFYNFTWNCPNYGASALNLTWGGNVIGGNVTVFGCDNRTYLRFTDSKTGNSAPGANVVTINGDILLHDFTSALTSTGSSGLDTIEVHVKGNITSYGLLNLANGSGGFVNWYLSGNLNIIGGQITTNSTASRPDSLLFVGSNPQTFFKSDSLASASNINFALAPGAVVNLDSTAIGGTSTTFTMPSGTTLITAHKFGLKGDLNMGGSIKLPVDGNYVYNGTVAQIDSLLPVTMNNLTINNPTTVTLVQPITVNDTLKLLSGVLDNSVNSITIGAAGTVVFAGGVTAVPIPGWPNGIKDIAPAPRVFKLFNNYPNPFNPSTQIRFSVPKDGFTTLKVLNILGQEVATLFEGTAKAGNLLEITFNAKALSSGIYFARLQQDSKISIQKMILMK